jgi:hypothetical protein
MMFWGSGGTTSHILYLQGENLQYPLDRTLGWVDPKASLDVMARRILVLLELNLGCPAPSLVTILT